MGRELRSLLRDVGKSDDPGSGAGTRHDPGYRTERGKDIEKELPGWYLCLCFASLFGRAEGAAAERGESEAEIRKRLDKVREEIAEARGYDYVIFNDSLEKAVERLQVIYQAEKSRASRMSKQIQGVLDSE